MTWHTARFQKYCWFGFVSVSTLKSVYIIFYRREFALLNLECTAGIPNLGKTAILPELCKSYTKTCVSFHKFQVLFAKHQPTLYRCQAYEVLTELLLTSPVLLMSSSNLPPLSSLLLHKEESFPSSEQKHNLCVSLHTFSLFF